MEEICGLIMPRRQILGDYLKDQETGWMFGSEIEVVQLKWKLAKF